MLSNQLFILVEPDVPISHYIYNWLFMEIYTDIEVKKMKQNSPDLKFINLTDLTMGYVDEEIV